VDSRRLQQPKDTPAGCQGEMRQCDEHLRPGWRFIRLAKQIIQIPEKIDCFWVFLKVLRETDDLVDSGHAVGTGEVTDKTWEILIGRMHGKYCTQPK
jgi:hypothetical protein